MFLFQIFIAFLLFAMVTLLTMQLRILPFYAVFKGEKKGFA